MEFCQPHETGTFVCHLGFHGVSTHCAGFKTAPPLPTSCTLEVGPREPCSVQKVPFPHLNSELTPVHPSAKLPRCGRVGDRKVRIRWGGWVDGTQHTASSTVRRDPGVNWKKVSLRTRNSRATWKSNKEKRGQENAATEAERQEGAWHTSGYL